MGVKLRDQIFHEAVQTAFDELSAEDQERLDSMVARLCKSIRDMTPRMALEILAKMGIFTAFQNKALVDLMNKIDETQAQEKGVTAEQMERYRWNQGRSKSLQDRMVLS